MSLRFAIALLSTLLPLPAAAATLSVGPDATYSSISAAARVARDGDTVEIAAGEYRGDVAVWTQKKLTIRGLGDGAVLIADGAHAEGKAIWVIRQGEFDISNITFRGARVPDTNGAGIRFEHGKLRVANCRFIDNQMGILTSNDGISELTVVDSEFGDAPPDNRELPHLLYAGRIARLEVSGSVFYHARRGHLLKSRARENLIQYNRLDDGNTGSASYELEFPNGGQAVVIGNLIGQSRHTQNPVIVSYGAEGQHWPDNGLYLAYNTLVDNRPERGRFVQVWQAKFSPAIALVARNNLLIGNGTFDIAADASTGGNIRLPARHSDTPTAPDFRLASDSPLRGKVFAGAMTPFGDLRPSREFTPPRGTRPLTQAANTPGAMQTPRP